MDSGSSKFFKRTSYKYKYHGKARPFELFDHVRADVARTTDHKNGTQPITFFGCREMCRDILLRSLSNLQYLLATTIS